MHAADSKHQSLPQGSQQPTAGTNEHTQSEQQQDAAQQQYSEADVAAYWQYYGGWLVAADVAVGGRR